MGPIDLNCDLGESFGAYTIGMDERVLAHVTSANIACGWHAGDPLVMDRTVQLAQARNVGIGAHPGLPDRLGFGRRKMQCSTEEIRAYIIYQVGALAAFCQARGATLRHVKPHGALYNMAAADPALLRAIAEAVASVDDKLLLVTLAGKNQTAAQQICNEIGIRPVFEAFADRAYTAGGDLVGRKRPGAVMDDPETVAHRVLDMVTHSWVRAVDGVLLPLHFQTICVHGDSTAALALIQTIAAKLDDAGIDLKPMQPAGA